MKAIRIFLSVQKHKTTGNVVVRIQLAGQWDNSSNEHCKIAKIGQNIDS